MDMCRSPMRSPDIRTLRCAVCDRRGPELGPFRNGPACPSCGQSLMELLSPGRESLDWLERRAPVRNLDFMDGEGPGETFASEHVLHEQQPRTLLAERLSHPACKTRLQDDWKSLDESVFGAGLAYAPSVVPRMPLFSQCKREDDSARRVVGQRCVLSSPHTDFQGRRPERSRDKENLAPCEPHFLKGRLHDEWLVDDAAADGQMRDRFCVSATSPFDSRCRRLFATPQKDHRDTVWVPEMAESELSLTPQIPQGSRMRLQEDWRKVDDIVFGEQPSLMPRMPAFDTSSARAEDTPARRGTRNRLLASPNGDGREVQSVDRARATENFVSPAKRKQQTKRVFREALLLSPDRGEPRSSPRTPLHLQSSPLLSGSRGMSWNMVVSPCSPAPASVKRIKNGGGFSSSTAANKVRQHFFADVVCAAE